MILSRQNYLREVKLGKSDKNIKSTLFILEYNEGKENGNIVQMKNRIA